MMKGLRAAALAAICSFSAGGVALAADLYTPPPEAAPAPATYFSWAGPYLGIQGGWQFGDEDDGPVAGLFAGYNFLFSAVVLGIDANLNAVFDDDDDVGLIGNVRGRLGLPIADAALVYGSFGAAFGDDDDVGLTAGAGVDFAISGNLFGRLDYAATFAGWDDDDDDIDHTVLVGLGWKLQ